MVKYLNYFKIFKNEYFIIFIIIINELFLHEYAHSTVATLIFF